jgi:hypothetical protein
MALVSVTKSGVLVVSESREVEGSLSVVIPVEALKGPD